MNIEYFAYQEVLLLSVTTPGACTYFMPVHKTYSVALIVTINNKASLDYNKCLSIGGGRHSRLGGHMTTTTQQLGGSGGTN